MGLLDFRWQTCGQEQVRFALRVFQRPRFLRHPHFKYFKVWWIFRFLLRVVAIG